MENKNLTMKEFAECVKEELKLHYEDAFIRVHEVIKTNDRKLMAVNICEKSSRISPTIYLDCYYEQYIKGEVSMESIIEEIRMINDEKEGVKSKIMQSEIFSENKETFLNHVCMKVINREKSEQFLLGKPYVPFLNLAVVFYIPVFSNDEGQANCMITNDLLLKWDISEGELFKRAKENTERIHPYKIVPMSEIIMGMLCDDCGTLESEDVITKEELAESSETLYVLSNDVRTNGATAILKSNILHDFALSHDAEKIWIIPSSIHELILIPSTGEEEASMINSEMIKEVNATQLLPEEVLADNLYVYDVEKNCIEIAE